MYTIYVHRYIHTYIHTNIYALAHKETHTYTHSCHASFDLIYDLVYVVGIANLSFNLISTMRAWSDPVYQEQCMAMNISMVRSMYSAACDGAAAEGVLGLWNQPCDITSAFLFGVLMIMMMELWLFEVSDIHAYILFMMIGRVHNPAPNFTHLLCTAHIPARRHGRRRHPQSRAAAAAARGHRMVLHTTSARVCMGDNHCGNFVRRRIQYRHY